MKSNRCEIVWCGDGLDFRAAPTFHSINEIAIQMGCEMFSPVRVAYSNQVYVANVRARRHESPEICDDNVSFPDYVGRVSELIQEHRVMNTSHVAFPPKPFQIAENLVEVALCKGRDFHGWSGLVHRPILVGDRLSRRSTCRVSSRNQGSSHQTGISFLAFWRLKIYTHVGAGEHIFLQGGPTGCQQSFPSP
jgi:hypothetical protein